MSMVGYMVGLGDRHGENILLDSITGGGGVTHVDFSCLFNKGDRMEIPEVVPFRLTHNMVWAMGPTGYEGMFVEACEITVRLMRVHIEQLLSVVRPFIYDPLLEWNRNCKRDEYTEMTNQCGRENTLNIQHRLLGHVRNNDKVFTERVLSVEGQTQMLIAEATSIDNLCQMFIGWGAYL
ncbi:LOW QUALITY PROTEIN: serine/threonine-protein kinase ATR-like [Nilaparvata lugens]|uniref:LOW QUALITY PROTEIN: serine/threonine-protein kinase ATR-like n=1 Tax=Nilaparvata lugens TaxID=108931 RepID=UPI00193E362B|nr:LOW QUALITY PROTEIN: serine/threonine-protein kinase ATR-like [Nilaparvata lugens]